MEADIAHQTPVSHVSPPKRVSNNSEFRSKTMSNTANMKASVITWSIWRTLPSIFSSYRSFFRRLPIEMGPNIVASNPSYIIDELRDHFGVVMDSIYSSEADSSFTCVRRARPSLNSLENDRDG